MNIYKFRDYKEFVRKWLENQPRKGHGYYAKMAEALDVSAVMISQIFSGPKNLSPEHAFLLAGFLGLTHDEKNYFLLLVNFEKAGSHALRQHLLDEIKKIQKEKTENLNQIVAQDIKLSEADKAVFYSSWLYSALRLQTSIDGFQSVEALAQKFALPREEIQRHLEFLVEKNLCVRTNKGYRMGPQRTHLEAGSPYIKTRQISWRVKGFEKMDSPKDTGLFYTAPFSIAESQFAVLRQRLTDVIKELSNTLVQDKPEKLACLNIDLFEI